MLRSPARTRVPAHSPGATASPPKPSANGACAALPIIRIARRDPTRCPGKPARKSGRFCARCASPLASRSMISSSSSRIPCPTLNQDAVYRILKAEGLNRLPPAEQTRRPHETFEEYEAGFVYNDASTCPNCRIAAMSRASAPYTSPSTAHRGTYTSPSRTTRSGPRPSPS